VLSGWMQYQAHYSSICLIDTVGLLVCIVVDGLKSLYSPSHTMLLSFKTFYLRLELLSFTGIGNLYLIILFCDNNLLSLGLSLNDLMRINKYISLLKWERVKQFIIIVRLFVSRVTPSTIHIRVHFSLNCSWCISVMIIP